MQQLWQTTLDADWAWRIAAWVLLASALVLLLWALFWDRPGWRGRPREWCRRCRYDMTGVPGEASITCPECGRVARSRRALRKTRRRWGMTTLALVLLASRYVAIHKDRIRDHGWQVLIPTTAMLFLWNPERWYRIEFDEEGWEYRLSDRFYWRLGERLSVGTGWQRDIWTWRLAPVLDRRHTWASHDISTIIPYRVSFKSGHYDHFNHWYPGGPQVDDATDEACEALADLIVYSVNTNDWHDFGGHSQSLFIIGDRLYLLAPKHTLRQAESILAYLNTGGKWPEGESGTLALDEKYLVQIDLEYLLSSPSWQETIRTRESHAAYEHARGLIEGHFPPYGINPFLPERDEIRQSVVRDCLWLIMRSVEPENWASNGGGHNDWVVLPDRIVFILSTDIDQKLIEQLDLIRRTGPQAIINANASSE